MFQEQTVFHFSLIFPERWAVESRKGRPRTKRLLKQIDWLSSESNISTLILRTGTAIGRISDVIVT